MSTKIDSHLKANSPSQAEVNDLLSQFQKGDLASAEKLAIVMAKKHPTYLLGWKVLGVVRWKLGRIYDALHANQKVVELAVNDADAYSNLGITLKALGRLDEAETCYKKAIMLDPKFSEAYCNLGSTQKALGRLEDAEANYRQAIVLNANFAEAHSNLGNTLYELGRLEEAETSHKQAISLNPDYALAYSNLGNTLSASRRLEEAEASYRKAITLAPGFVEARSNLALTLYELGELEESMRAVVASIKIQPTILAQNLFVQLCKYKAPETWDPKLSEMVTAALLEPWARPSAVMGTASNLLKLDPEFIQELIRIDTNTTESADDYLNDLLLDKSFASSELMYAMLCSSHINDHELELFFTKLRYRYLLQAISNLTNGIHSHEVPLKICYLAKQCFINEYVYFETEVEIDHVKVLLKTLTTAIARVDKIQPFLVIAIACYVPLSSVAGCEQLLHRNWPTNVVSVLKQQIQEPHDEIKLRASIPCLTSAENTVSLDVQNMYEENPYPRWVRLPKKVNARSLNVRMRELFSSDVFSPLLDDRSPEILIAGCGTGQHPISTAQLIKGSRVLAIDLSVASLSYAKRKALELGIENIEFAQADLLQLGTLGRTFDVIESMGVLHHLDKPFEGWKVLLSLLKPQGFMKLGFYSELARKDIVKVRNLIAKECIGSSAREIRAYRKRLHGLEDRQDFGFATRSGDFFSTSACRDLLFHVQEHRMTLPKLASFLKENDLNFLGFEIDTSVKRLYSTRFPNDPVATDLENWHILEQEYPDTFTSMYQFWIQKSKGQKQFKDQYIK